MKKMFFCCSTLCAALLLFCATALASDVQITVTPVDAASVQVAQVAKGENDVAFNVTKSGGAEKGQLYLIMIQEGASASEKPKPTKDNLYYLNVEEATGATFSTEAYPKDLKADSTYVVYLSDYSSGGNGTAKGVATIATKSGGGADIMYGDVNGDGSVNGRDLTALARYLADRKDYMPGGSKAINLENANCNGKDGVNGRDLTSLARHLADRQEYAVLPH